jgi:hypothetical protein
MILNNDSCICKNCVYQNICYDCRTFRLHEKILAKQRSVYTTEHEQKIRMAIEECSFFMGK